MASDASFVQFIVDQISAAGEISSRKMFGEYALYCNAKVVALICDNKLFLKPTAGGRKYIGKAVEAPAYPGAKSSFLIEDKLEDRKWLTELVRITEKEVPEPKPRKKSRRKSPRKEEATKRTKRTKRSMT
jgi:TfoX/Sxy family transcriptional regulator of competence genes